MNSSRQEGGGKKKINEVQTFPVPFVLSENKEDINITTKSPYKLSKSSKEQIINQAIKFHLKGNILEAAKYYQYCINKGFNDHIVFSNYGAILQDLGKFKEAELSYRKAIELKPDYAEAYSNLGNTLKDLGKFKDAELSYCKAIELKPDYAKAHSNLGIIFKKLGKSEDAELSYRKAIELKPDYAEAHSNLGVLLNDLGKLQDAELSYRKAIEIKPDYAEAHYNLGNLLKELGKLQDAELSYRKAIEIKPDYAEAHYNLGNILRDLGKLKEAELSYRKAIEINPNYVKAYYSLSLLKYSDKNMRWKNKLFSESILNKKSQKEQIDIYFARANILHKEKKYEESSRNLKLANKLKLDIKPSELNKLLSKSQALIIESNKKEINKKEHRNSSESIFIVGMPRSGSTLLESILSMRNDVYDLGEINILEESFLECKKSKQEINLAELYEKKVNNKTELNITTNKWLYNYQYAGIISRHIPNAKIIHCYRNPLDNILSIYRTHFAKGNEYSSSLVDCAKVYLDQEAIMTLYKDRFRSKIYDLNYDLLVNEPNKEIHSLISWLGWEWNDSYLSPHLNKRSVSTASNVQVRSKINSKSIGGWRNYQDMLKPATKILSQTDRYRNLTS